MMCVNMVKECDGCMACQEPKLLFKDEDGDAIYEGDEYYDIFGTIVSVENIYKYKKIAEEEK